MVEKRQRVKLVSEVTCVICLEALPAGMTAYYSPNTGLYTHYGKCAGAQRKEDIQKAMKRIGMDEETVGSINKLVDYLYRDERKDFESRGEDEVDGHIFLDVERVKKFMGRLS